MMDIYERGYTVPFSGNSDCEAITHAISEARAMGLYKTVIPRYNKRTGVCRWVLDAPVLVPENFTLVFDNAEVAFTDNGSILVMGEERKPAESIHIFGIGNARLIDEGTYGAMMRIAFAKNVRLHGLTFKNRGTRGIFCLGMTDSYLYDLTFDGEFPPKEAENTDAEENTIRRKNAGGLMLSAGCKGVTVEHIYGKTYGHTVEISAFSGETECDTTQDILVRDVRSDCYTFSNVHLVNAEGHLLSNIMIDGVTDTSKVGALYRGRATVSIGDTVFGRTPSALGEIRNMTVKNITSRAFAAVNIIHSVQDITVADLTIREDGGCGMSCDRTLAYHNIYFCNIKFDDRKTPPYAISEVKKPSYIQPPRETDAHFYPYRAVCNMRDIHGGNFKINGIYANMLDNLLRITGKNSLEMYDVDVENIVYDDIVGGDCIINEEV
ncbi:MAG: hypothetical protein IJC78_07000 [Clostridia bacterium]|nr:hypothetical protein [Clostridia bacterium]